METILIELRRLVYPISRLFGTALTVSLGIWLSLNIRSSLSHQKAQNFEGTAKA
jgi:hypothetical protein